LTRKKAAPCQKKAFLRESLSKTPAVGPRVRVKTRRPWRFNGGGRPSPGGNNSRGLVAVCSPGVGGVCPVCAGQTGPCGMGEAWCRLTGKRRTSWWGTPSGKTTTARGRVDTASGRGEAPQKTSRLEGKRGDAVAAGHGKGGHRAPETFRPGHVRDAGHRLRKGSGCCAGAGAEGGRGGARHRREARENAAQVVAVRWQEGKIATGDLRLTQPPETPVRLNQKKFSSATT